MKSKLKHPPHFRKKEKEKYCQKPGTACLKKKKIHFAHLHKVAANHFPLPRCLL